jgi:Cu/Ag efflux pump CusA
LRKEAKKAKKNGIAVKSSNKTTRIPNSFPHKMELMQEQEKTIKAEQEEKAKQSKKGKKKIEEDPVVMEDKDSQVITEAPEAVRKNNSKQELNELIEICDVIIQVIDARDPPSYRSKELENNIRTKGKKLIILLNKIDLVSEYNKLI